ncbi:GNAT family N-acetyltransferase [Bacillus lacus]|uniref:GNAT family N-acetyltransferase n=1 Tax=Metabacillus lacus TaxID=1983721 RepID=A0A7X2IYX9_9BACI|nr:GNAT family protein [Metabacillus lacus]MRX72361.1 GNAT family N-acetyltransferase [Metabacillus lacus]
MSGEQFPRLETDRLILREMVLEDAPQLYRYWSDSQTVQYMNIEKLKKVQEAEDMIALLNSLYEKREAVRWTITEKESGQIIGTCGYNSWEKESQRAEVGYDLGWQHWGRGFMSEALPELLAYGFQVWELHRIEAKVYPENEASRRLLNKLGFTEEGVLRKYEKRQNSYEDVILYSLLKGEFGEK